jgi:predicted nuclease of predicted toxin-antitoxin system
MRLLLDQGLPRSAAQLLRDGRHDAVHTGQCGLATSSDAAILEHARDQAQVVVTLDADFHALMALSKATAPSVIRIRIEGLDSTELAELLRAVLERVGEDLQVGALVSVTENQIRVRRLPVGVAS